MFNNVMTWLITNWYVPCLVIIFIGLYGVKKIANQKAKNIALESIYKLEDEVFATLDAKIDAIAELGYSLLSAKLKLFITKEVFREIVVQTYKQLKNLVDVLDGDSHTIKK